MKGQDPLQFVDDLVNFYTRCDMDIKQIVPFTVAALEDNMAQYVRTQNPKSLQDVRTAISQYSGTSAVKLDQQSSTDSAIKSLCSKLDEVATQLATVSAIQEQSQQWHQHRRSVPRTTTQQQAYNKRNCTYCGGKFHTKLSDCPARNKTCAKCGKLNHFAKVCKSISE